MTQLEPLPAAQALDRYFLEARCKILDLAAIFDRIGRGPGAGGLDDDSRLQRLHEALQLLLDPSGGRAERIQQIFSLTYDPDWERPKPR